MSREFVKYTVNLTLKAMDALSRAAQLNEHTRTDTINRSVQVYAFLCHEMAMGKELCLVDPETGESERIRFL